MKLAIVIVSGALAGIALGFALFVSTTPNARAHRVAFARAQTPVERLSYTREAAADAGSRYKLVAVHCKETRRAYMYVCNFGGKVRATGKTVCAATFVHYNPNLNARRVNFWNASWACGGQPPKVPAPYPGDVPGA